MPILCPVLLEEGHFSTCGNNRSPRNFLNPPPFAKSCSAKEGERRQVNSFDHDDAEPFIVNLPGPDAGNYLELTTRKYGEFEVLNSRTQAMKHYALKR